MPGWYDIVRPRSQRNFTDLTAAQDTLGIRSTKQAFHTLIDNQISSSVPPERIIIGGFSQGGSIALLAGLSYPKRLGGVFAMSSYLLMGDGFRAEIPLANVNGQTPLWMGHGKADPLVKYEWGVLTREKLKGWGYESEWKDYDGMGHSACPEEISDLEAFLTRLLQ
ncbi:MAG: hypothetical protein M1814_003761 [Vezdaea aestivalis]|nr:MAG: hypothetical protein M1814_003761 [Vezdaea aestivalis]